MRATKEGDQIAKIAEKHAFICSSAQLVEKQGKNM